MAKTYKSLSDFYPYYLGEHRNGTCRVLHFVGTNLVLALLLTALILKTWALLLALPLAGYGFAWAGHFFFEKNRPATFTYPLYSFLSDWLMWRDILFFRIPATGELPAHFYAGAHKTSAQA